MTSIETSLPPLVLLTGALLSVALSIYLLWQQTKNHSKKSRWSLFILRSILCLLIWTLIAQPRTVQTSKESLSVSANLGIDVSQSMSLIDERGPITNSWTNYAEPRILDEALTLTEAARIRLNLQARHLSSSQTDFEAEIESILKILAEARERIKSLKSDSSLTRLLKAPTKTLESSSEILKVIKRDEAFTELNRASQLLSQTAHSLRGITATAGLITSDTRNTEPRIDKVNGWLKATQNLFTDLTARYDLRLSTFASDLASHNIKEPLKADGAQGLTTNLFDSLNRLSRADQTKGRQFSLLVTDGHDSGDAEQSFSSEVLSQPLIVLPVGDALTSPDSSVGSVIAPSRIRKDDSLKISVEVSAQNATPQIVSLLLKEGEEIIESQEVELRGDGTSKRVELKWKAIKMGLHKFKVELLPITGEDLLGNNSRSFDCTVIKDQYRVLVCDSFPRWETRYLQNLFNRDPSIEMSSVVFQPRHTFPGNQQEDPATLPFDRESWQAYDLVILGDLTPEYLTNDHQKLVRDYVDKGGNLIILAGNTGMPSQFMEGPLEPLIPMTKVSDKEVPGSFTIHPPKNQPINHMVLLAEGETHQIWNSTFQAVPQHSLVPWLKTKESARTLLKATNTLNNRTYDFCATQRYGSGKIAFFAASCLYHLRFQFGDKYHAKLWGQMIRGMCVDTFGFSESLIAARLDRLLWHHAEEIQGRVRIRHLDGRPFEDQNFTATLVKNGVVVTEVKPIPVQDRPGDYYLRFNDVPPGDYQLSYSGGEIQSILSADQEFNPDQSPIELTVEKTSGPHELQIPTTPSKFWGKINDLPLAATIAPATLPLMIEALDFEPEFFETTSKSSIWDTWWLLSTILLIAGTEWCLRRLTGLS